jgi:hypothetical protein
MSELTFQGWDKGLSYSSERDKIAELLRLTRNRRDKAFLSIACVSVCNGSRIGESITALLSWAKNGKREQRVRVEKRADKYMRLIIIPSDVNKYKNLKTEFAIMEERYVDFPNVAAQRIRRMLGYNSHALRYAWIGGMAETMNAQEIAKITGHKKLDIVLHYTQARTAERKHRELVK